MRLKLNDASQDGDVDDRINTIGYQKLQSKRFLTFAMKKNNRIGPHNNKYKIQSQD